MDFSFATPQEIALEMGRRLKVERLAQGLAQPELALRAGVSVGTVKALENTGQSTLLSFVRVVQALGFSDHLDGALVRPLQSIAAMQRAAPRQRRRAPRRPRPESRGPGSLAP